jgi:hypothetical protein
MAVLAAPRTLLDSIEPKVRQYAAEGQLQGSDFAGDSALDDDSATSDVLRQADTLLNPQHAKPDPGPYPRL